MKRVLSKAGSAAAIAALLGGSLKRQNVEYWFRRTHPQFPAEHCPALEHAYGVRCEELRPDVTWVRVPDKNWPKGKPLLDVAACA